jgi:fused signal recognition particle receptor
VAIEAELDVPVKLAGVGEGIDDLVRFDVAEFVRAIFVD